jgi:hypothetical protein
MQIKATKYIPLSIQIESFIKRNTKLKEKYLITNDYSKSKVKRTNL